MIDPMARRLGVVCLVAAAMATAAESQRPLDITSQSAPVFTTFGTKDGLSDEVWSTIGFDRHGFVWAGSASSLARFDGYRWTTSPFHAGQGLVRDLESDDRGNLWAIFEKGGLAKYDGRTWSFAGPSREFHEWFSQTTDPSGKRTLWVPRERNFLRLDGETWINEPEVPATAQGPVRMERTETLFGEPRQWLLSRSGLWFRSLTSGSTPPAPWQLFTEAGLDRVSGIDLKRTVDKGHEELWILHYGHPLRRITATGIRTWRTASGELPTEAMYSSVATYTSDGERLLWISSRAGLLRIRGDEVTVFDRRHGLPSDAVRGIKLQRAANGEEFLWVATEGGIARATLEDSAWRTVSLHGARLNGVMGLLIEPDGRGSERLWIGSAQEGAAMFERGQWRSFRKENGGLPDNGTTGFWRVTGPDETPWRLVALDSGKLVRIRDDFSLQEIPVPWIAPLDFFTGSIVSRRFDGARELWFASRAGLYRWRNGQWKHFAASNARQPWRVSRVIEQIDAAGRAWMWAASEQGIARFDGESWDLLPVDVVGVNSAFRGITLITERGRAILWAGSMRNGVVRLDVTDPQKPAAIKDADVPQPKDPTVYSILQDSHGRVYYCTNNGVQQLTPRPGGGYDERLFRRPDGLVHDECNTNSQSIDDHDRYWVGTLGGLGVYDPDLRPPSKSVHPKPLYFTDVRADGLHHDPLVETSLTLPAGAREVRVDFALLAGQRERESRYRSQLIGYDPHPSEWTTENSRSFTGLPPASYQLAVEARDFAGTTSASRTLSFTVLPFWWQRPVARAGFAAGLLLLVAGGTLAYNRNLRERQKQLEREVAARTSDLDAANLRLTELSYLDPLTGIANRRRLTEAIDAAIERAAAKSLPLGLIVVDVDHFKAYNDRFGHLAGDAALRAVSQALSNATREQDLVARFGGEEFACLLQDASVDVVEVIAERMRALVEALPPRVLGNASQTLTISAGFVCRVPSANERAADLLAEADGALYDAKREGRNRVRQTQAKA